MTTVYGNDTGDGARLVVQYPPRRSERGRAKRKAGVAPQPGACKSGTHARKRARVAASAATASNTASAPATTSTASAATASAVSSSPETAALQEPVSWEEVECDPNWATVPLQLEPDFKLAKSNRGALAELKGLLPAIKEKRTGIPVLIKVPAAMSLDIRTMLAGFLGRRLEGPGTEVGPDHLIVKAPSGVKNLVAGELRHALKVAFPNGLAITETDVMVNGMHKIPDAHLWVTKPTKAELRHPLANACPPPDGLWVEVCFNDKDRDEALNKFQDVIPHYRCTFLVICLMRDDTPAMARRIGAADAANTPLPRAAAGVAVAGAPVAAPFATLAPPEVGRPRWAPYVGYWPSGAAYGAAQWYKLHRDRYINLEIPAPAPASAYPGTPFQLLMDDIIDWAEY